MRRMSRGGGDAVDAEGELALDGAELQPRAAAEDAVGAAGEAGAAEQELERA